MRRFCYYHKETGLLSERTLVVNSPTAERDAAANAPPDHAPLEGDFHHQRHRVDIATGAVIDYQPPAPSEHHEWHESSRQCLLKPEAAEMRAAHFRAMGELQQLDAKALRAMTDHIMGDKAAAARLSQIETQKNELRPKVITNKDALALLSGERAPLKARE